MSPRIRIASLAASAVLGFSLFGAAPALATEASALPAACTLDAAGLKAAEDELVLIKAQLKGGKPSKAEKRAIVAAIRELQSAARASETKSSRKRKGAARSDLKAKLHKERNPEVRAVLRLQLDALNESLESGRMTKTEKIELKAKRAQLVDLLSGKPDKATKKLLQKRRAALKQLIEPCLPAEEAPVVQPLPEEPVVQQPVAEQPVAEQPVAEQPVAEQPVAEETPTA